jgi:hypothetical protein
MNMTLQEAMEEIFGHGFVFTLRPKKALEALKVIRKTLLDYKQLKTDYADLDNRLRTANTEIDRLQSVSSWIPCSERLPEKDGDYLCISNNEYKILPYRNREFYCVCFDAVLRRCNKSVTHWMPVPEAPQRKDDTR